MVSAAFTTDETVIPLREAGTLAFMRTWAGAPHPVTLARWASAGVNGVVLESFKVGGSRMTSVEACERFIQRLSGKTPTPTPTPASRTRRHKRALEQLDAEGI